MKSKRESPLTLDELVRGMVLASLRIKRETGGDLCFSMTFTPEQKPKQPASKSRGG